MLLKFHKSLIITMLLCCSAIAGMGIVIPFSASIAADPTASTARYENQTEELLKVDPQNSANQPLIIIYSTSAGFEPSELRARPGEKILLIRNRTGEDNLTFVISRPGQSPAEIVRVGSALGTNVFAKVPFAPGEVTITEPNHDWKCRIQVNP